MWAKRLKRFVFARFIEAYGVKYHSESTVRGGSSEAVCLLLTREALVGPHV